METTGDRGRELRWAQDGEVVFSMREHPEPRASRPVLGVVTPQHYMRAELERLSRTVRIVPVAPPATDWSETTIAHWARVLEEAGASAVLGLAQKDAWHHSLLNRAIGTPSPSALGYLVAMSKFLQRAALRDLTPEMWFVGIDPERDDDDTIAATVPEWPCIFKHTTSSRGDGVYKCDGPEELLEIVELYRRDEPLQRRIAAMNDGVLPRLGHDDRGRLDELTDGCGPPPFLAEQLIDMREEWIEYCYEGAVSEDGTHKRYGITEKLYFDDAACFGRVTPPVNLHADHIEATGRFVDAVAERFVELGFRRQHFNLDLWVAGGADPTATPRFLLCEMNPRCVHTFQRSYRAAYGSDMYLDNARLVLDDVLPVDSPWDVWRRGDSRVGCIMFLNVKNQVDPESSEVLVEVEGCRAGDLVDYGLVERLEREGVLLQVRLTRHEDHVLTREEGRASPGTTLMQLWIDADTHEELAAKEMQLRRRLYRVEQPFSRYPAYWRELASRVPVTA